jgi:hypothetical protein
MRYIRRIEVRHYYKCAMPLGLDLSTLRMYNCTTHHIDGRCREKLKPFKMLIRKHLCLSESRKTAAIVRPRCRGKDAEVCSGEDSSILHEMLVQWTAISRILPKMGSLFRIELANSSDREIHLNNVWKIIFFLTENTLYFHYTDHRVNAL